MKKYPFAAVLMALFPAGAAAADDSRTSFEFNGWAGPPVRVFIGVPPGLKKQTPVVFVMHGVRRNAETYRDQWLDLARSSDFLLVVPEFRQEDFPGSAAYNLGGVFDDSGAVRPRALWAYSA